MGETSVSSALLSNQSYQPEIFSGPLVVREMVETFYRCNHFVTAYNSKVRDFLFEDPWGVNTTPKDFVTNMTLCITTNVLLEGKYQDCIAWSQLQEIQSTATVSVVLQGLESSKQWG